MTEYAIQTRDLSKRFGKLAALTGVSLDIPMNTVSALLAPTSGGKTTLVKCLLGAYPPTSGSATVLGMDIVKDSMKIRRNVGYAPQEQVFDETMTVASAMQFAAQFAIGGDKAVARSQNILDHFGFTGKEKRVVERLDIAEKSRLSAAQAFVNNPPLVILDQIIDRLDPLDRDEMFEKLNQLRAEYGTTIVLVSTNADAVERFADYAAILIKGKLAAQGYVNDMVKSGDLDHATVRISGGDHKAIDQIKGQTWVKSVVSETISGGELWTVVTEDGAASTKLLPLLASSGVSVMEFQADHLSLEDVFKRLLMEAEAA